jgi:hypothetical protein
LKKERQREQAWKVIKENEVEKAKRMKERDEDVL